MCCLGKLLPRTCDCSTRKPVFMLTKAGQQLLVQASATFVMATGKMKSDRHGSRQLRAPGQWRFRGNERDSSAVSSLGQATSQQLC